MTQTVQAELLDDGSVATAKIADGAVSTLKVADGAVTAVKLASSSVTSAKMAANAVTTAAITDANVTPAKLSQPLTQGTAVASTSGTSIDFTSIPSWAKRITVLFSQVSSNTLGTNLIVQLGTSSGVETTGYASGSCWVGNSNTTSAGVITNGLYVVPGLGASNNYSGTMTLTNVSGNTWIAATTGSVTDSAYCSTGGGSKTLAAVLDRIRITTTTGTPTFDGGSVNIMYE